MIPSPEATKELQEGTQANPLVSAEATVLRETAGAADADETIYLMGRPTLKQYQRFMKTNAVGRYDPAALTEEWNKANDVIKILEKEEAGIADNPAITKLGPEYKPQLIRLLSDPVIQNSFNTVPTEIALIDLNRVVVYQKHIDVTFSRQLKNKMGTSPTRDQIFRTCLPYDHPRPPVKWSRMHRNTFVFVSPSNDMRYLGAMQLEPRHIKDYTPPGDTVGIIGLSVGFGSNFLNAFYAENRLVLHNGSHRAYTLWEMGLTYVPCIIQHVSNRHELDVIAASEVVDDPDYYLRHPRPPMLKDYFNPLLRKIVKTHRRTRQVTVKFEIDEGYIPSL